MEDLIKALTIMMKYMDGYNLDYPTHCEHDELMVCVDPDKISTEDLNELSKLGFIVGDGCMISYKYGSC